MSRWLSLFLLCFGLCAQADIKQQLYARHVQERTLASTSIEQGTFEQWIDHQDPSLGTFKQRYYFDNTFAQKKNAPVFFYICGESVCQPSALLGAIRTYAKRFHARLIALEHRYYGQSIPNQSLATENLQYLSTENALRDLARFQQAIQKEKNWLGKWIAFGGSYPGSLSAYYREQYSQLVRGALASSAPVRAEPDFQAYDAHVTQVAGPQCAARMQQAVREVEEALGNPEQLAQIKALFSASHIKDNTDFLYVIADVGAAAVQYGMKHSFCQSLMDAKTPLEGYAIFARQLYNTWHVDPESFVAQGAMSTDPKDYPEGLGMRQWFYQSCREYGYWQNAHQDPLRSTRSHFINAAYHQQICKRLFNMDTSPKAEEMNQHFYQPLLSAKQTSGIFFVNGQDDPWMTLSLTEENGLNSKHTYYSIAEAAHCADLHAPKPEDSTALQEARALIVAQLSKWLF